MGSKNKLRRFKENETFENVIQPSREELVSNNFQMKGQWRDQVFKNNRPIVLELGCGKGEYTLAMGALRPEINHIGIDIKGARFWRGAKTALETGLNNVVFLRMQIELIAFAFDQHEIDEIWITFPDPQIKYKRTKHRMTNPEFLNLYQNILKPEGIIHLKTDSEYMHGYTLGLLQGLGHEVIYSNHNVYKSDHTPELVTSVQTFYESQYLAKNKPITYLKFKFKR